MSIPSQSESQPDATELSGAERVRRAAITLAALGQDGLTYGVNDFDLDRYRKVSAVAAELLSVLTERPAEEFRLELGRDSGYATPKIDVRGVLFDDQERILLIRERTDGRWSLPGGWADPGDAPREAIVREIREESGYPAEVIKLIACWDRDRQGHLPPLAVHVYKLFFLCRVNGPAGAPDELETLDVGWFALDELPPLSEHRVHVDQLLRSLAHHRDPSLPTELD
jgi:ADP-ribose pyrophosphatase YjhB (NUDIX family)